MRVAPVIELIAGARAELKRISRARSSPQRQRERASIVLLASEGLENGPITRLHLSPPEQANVKRGRAKLDQMHSD